MSYHSWERWNGVFGFNSTTTFWPLKRKLYLKSVVSVDFREFLLKFLYPFLLSGCLFVCRVYLSALVVCCRVSVVECWLQFTCWSSGVFVGAGCLLLVVGVSVVECWLQSTCWSSAVFVGACCLLLVVGVSVVECWLESTCWSSCVTVGGCSWFLCSCQVLAVDWRCRFSLIFSIDGVQLYSQVVFLSLFYSVFVLDLFCCLCTNISLYYPYLLSFICYHINTASFLFLSFLYYNPSPTPSLTHICLVHLWSKRPSNLT
jgi:hypothetical protein